MRIVIDLTETQLRSLDETAKREKAPRDTLIRQAVDEYLTKHRPNTDDPFGLWGNREADGLEYQQRLRGEW